MVPLPINILYRIHICASSQPLHLKNECQPDLGNFVQCWQCEDKLYHTLNGNCGVCELQMKPHVVLIQAKCTYGCHSTITNKHQLCFGPERYIFAYDNRTTSEIGDFSEVAPTEAFTISSYILAGVYPIRTSNIQIGLATECYLTLY